MFRVVRGMKPAHKYVFQCLTWHWNDHEDKYGQCDPGEDLIAEETGYTPRQVVNIICELEKEGRLAKRTKLGRFHHCNDYDLFMTGRELLDLGVPESEIIAGLDDGKCKDFTLESEKNSLLNLKRFHFPWCKDFTFGKCKDFSGTGNSELPKGEQESENIQTQTPTASGSRSELQAASLKQDSEVGDGDKKLAEQVAHTPYPSQKQVGATVQRILEDWKVHPLSPEKRTFISDGLASRAWRTMVKLKDKLVNYFLDSVRKGYIAADLEKMEKVDQRHKRAPRAAAAPPEGGRAGLR